jgi:hypothetical protein
MQTVQALRLVEPAKVSAKQKAEQTYHQREQATFYTVVEQPASQALFQ